MIVSHPALCLRALLLLLLLPQHLHEAHGPHSSQPHRPSYGGQHSLGCNTRGHHSRHPGTDDGTRVHALAVVVAGGDFTILSRSIRQQLEF